MWHHLKPLALCAATLTLAAGCAHTTGETSQPAPVAPAAEPAPAAKEAPAAPAAGINKGTITEVIQAGRYSYVNLDSGSAKTWFAVPSSEVKVGQQVEVKPGMEIKDYTAKTLNRTFSSIYFSDQISISVPVGGKSGTPAGHNSIGRRSGLKKAIAGTVLEVIDGGEFKYLSVEGPGMKAWVALPASTAVAVGQTVKALPGEEILGFTSGKLNRIFERIVFSSGIDKQ